MINRQDIGLYFFYYLGIHKIRNYILRLQRKPLTRFVIFHDIPPKTLHQFESKLQFLKKNTNVVSMDDFFENRLSIQKINVVITFDDGYKSWITAALPILKHLNLPATFFISSGFIGLSASDEIHFVRTKLKVQCDVSGGLWPDDIKKLVSEGFCVGGHSSTHALLPEITNIQRLRQEIIADKCQLEKIIGGVIYYFSYPFGGDIHPQVCLSAVLREAGYRGAVTTQAGNNTIDTDPYFLHREITASSLALPLFKSRIYGNIDLNYRLKKFLFYKDRTLKKR